jgi:Histidine kinase-, DNA gyrase B-, and HSP90-like ATPase
VIRKMHTNRVAPMVERGYREGTKFQWVRETTINAIEAGATKIEFGVEWQAVKTKGVYRRMIADNGKGMSPEELQEFFNCFGGGGKPIGGEHENYGIGAKTALLPWNHHGVVVISWVDGQPAMIRIMRDETTGEYGLHIFETEDDEGNESREAVVEPYNDLEHGVDWREVKPSWIDQYGTVIVLLGNHPADDTFRGDLFRDEDGTKDIAQYLNHRLWDLKDRVQISAVEFLTTNKANWPQSEPASKHGQTGVIVRSVRGTKHYIANATLFSGATLESGTVKLRGNTEIDWYLWSGDPPRHHPTPRAGSISVLYRDELYNNQNHHNTYRMFGISENEVRRNLWLVVRPPELDRQAKSGVYPRAARDTLQWFMGQELPLSDWGQQFADQLPTPIVHALRKARGERSGSIDDDAWKQQLAQRFGSLWKVPRYRPDPEGSKQAGRATITELFPIAHPPRPVPPRPPRPPHPHEPVVPSNKPKFMPVGQDANAKKTMIKGGLPDFEITRDENAVEHGMLAAYTRPNMDKPTGLIVIYGEHPVLRHIVETYQRDYAPHLADDVRKVVEDVYGQVAVAKIAHSEGMCGLVDREVIDKQLRSPEALTMALLGLISEDCLIRQRLSKAIGKRRRAEAA